MNETRQMKAINLVLVQNADNRVNKQKQLETIQVDLIDVNAIIHE